LEVFGSKALVELYHHFNFTTTILSIQSAKVGDFFVTTILGLGSENKKPGFFNPGFSLLKKMR
jgi:hypothetical protein